MENWKSVVGYEGMYEISDMGHIRSVDRIVTRCDGMVWRLRGKLLKQATDHSGYPFVMLSKQGKIKNHRIHRMVMDAFSPTGKKREVNHIDGDKTNNTLINLEWVSSSENKAHAYSTGLGYVTPVVGCDPETGAVLREYKTMQDAVQDGYHKSDICRCCKGIATTHAGLAWKYA